MPERCCCLDLVNPAALLAPSGRRPVVGEPAFIAGRVGRAGQLAVLLVDDLDNVLVGGPTRATTSGIGLHPNQLAGPDLLGVLEHAGTVARFGMVADPV